MPPVAARFAIVVGSFLAVLTDSQLTLAQSAADVDRWKQSYLNERQDAVKLGELPARFTNADQLAAKADAAVKRDKYADAVRFLRDARWALPARPLSLPPNVARVIGYSRLRHGNRVNAIAYTPDGSKLVSCSRDGTARVWNLENGRELVVYRGHALPTDEGAVRDNAVFLVPALAISPDGTTVATSGGNEIHLWSLNDGKLLRKSPKVKRAMKGLAFTPDGKSVVSGGDDRIVRVWAVDTLQEKLVFPACKGRIESLAISPNGAIAAAADSEGYCTFFKLDGSDPKPLASVLSSDAVATGTYAIAYSADGARVFAAGGDANPRLLIAPSADGAAPTSTGNAITRFPGHTGRLLAAALSRDGKLAATGGNDQRIRVWDTVTGKLVRAYDGLASAATCVTIRGDGQQLAAASEDGTIRLWTLSIVDDHRAIKSGDEPLWATAIAPDGKTFAIAGADRSVRIVEVGTEKILHKLADHTGPITSLVYLTTEKLASASSDRTIKIWNAKSGTLLRSLDQHTSTVMALAASNDTIVSGGADRTVRGWDMVSGKLLWTWPNRSIVTAVAVTRNGSRVVVGAADGALQLLDTTTGTPKVLGLGRLAHPGGVAAISLSQDESRVATVGGDGKLALWAIGSEGSLTRVMKSEGGTTPLATVAFSPRKPLLAVAGADQLVQLVDANTGSFVRVLRGHSDWVTSLAFNPTDDAIVSVGVDSYARVFTLPTGEDVLATGHTRAVRGVALSPDGKRLASASDDFSVKVWDWQTGREVATLTGAIGALQTVTFLGNDRILAAGADGNVRLWSLENRTDTKTWPSGDAYLLAASNAPSSDRFAVWSRSIGETSDKYTFDRYTIAGSSITVSDTSGTSTCAVFSPDLKLAVSGHDTGHVRLWNLEQREKLGNDWPIQSRRLVDVGLTADAKQLVALDESGTVKIATIADRTVTKSFRVIGGTLAGLMVAPSGDRVAVFTVEGDVAVYDFVGQLVRKWTLLSSVNGLAFTNDGQYLVTANGDGTIVVLALR